MAWPLRIEFPGAFYHVMNRGNTGMNIYRSVRDREKFLEYAGEAVKRYGINGPAVRYLWSWNRGSA
jgi:putative transposase